MSSESWSHEIESSVSAARLFKASVLDWHNLGPKILPEIIASGEAISGEGAVGSVRQLNFTSAMPFTYMKERLDFIDHEKLECKSTIVEGGDLGTKIESGSFHFKFEPTASGGCLVKLAATFKPLAGTSVPGDIAEAKESVTGLIKATEAHLVANPEAYV
ncbi:pathogenesis-related protein 1-like [Iris pallida]|uniref:Pathogenesis-related protein 1-like n=1 Tax=Iris pallida TaxID=29817 RepID=A0AAX6F2Q8_IRIPA|nr:pathogenesis-related protein 1-like [Iris pallida]